MTMEGTGVEICFCVPRQIIFKISSDIYYWKSKFFKRTGVCVQCSDTCRLTAPE